MSDADHVDRIVLAVPDLVGPSIRLRPWRPDDAGALARAWRDPAVIAASSPPADRSEAAARRWIEGCDDRRLAGVALDLAVAAMDDDRVLGEVGIARIDARRRAALLGWWVHEEARGAGVGSTAVTLVVDWLLASSPVEHAVAEIASDNPASEAVARTAGFTRRTAGVWVRSRD